MNPPDNELPPLKALLAFEATVRLKSMTAAARELGISQPAVSQRIRAVEEVVGCVLTRRSGRGQLPTAAGEALYADVAEAVKQVEAAVRRSRVHAGAQESRISLTANFGFTYLWLLPRLARLEAAFPGVRFEILPEDDEQRLEARGADIAFAFGRAEGRSRYEFMLIPEIVFPVCSPALAERLGLDQRLDELPLETLPLLHKDEGDPRWLDWRKWSAAAGLPAPERARFCYHNYPLLLGAAEAGQGIALGWFGLLDEALASGRLRALEPRVQRPEYGYLLRSNYADTLLVASVLRWFEQQASPAAALSD